MDWAREAIAIPDFECFEQQGVWLQRDWNAVSMAYLPGKKHSFHRLAHSATNIDFMSGWVPAKEVLKIAANAKLGYIQHDGICEYGTEHFFRPVA